MSRENGTQNDGKGKEKRREKAEAGSVARTRIQHEFKGGGTWMTSTSESLPLCARYIWMFVCMCVYGACECVYTLYAPKKNTCVAHPALGWQIGEDKRRTRSGDKRNIIQ